MMKTLKYSVGLTVYAAAVSAQIALAAFCVVGAIATALTEPGGIDG